MTLKIKYIKVCSFFSLVILKDKSRKENVHAATGTLYNQEVANKKHWNIDQMLEKKNQTNKKVLICLLS